MFVEPIDALAAPRVRWALASLSLSMLMPSLDTSIANAGLPTLARVFAASFPAVQWIVLAYLLAITTLIVGVGRLGDLLGRRRLLMAGLALFTVASMLCGLAPTLSTLIAARAAQGLGAAIMMALTGALVGETVPKARTGSAMGLLGAMSAIGTMLGPSLGGVLIAGFGWRTIFLVNLPLGLVNLALAWRFLPVDRPRTAGGRARFDIVGTGLLAATLGAYALAMTLGRGRFGGLNIGLLAAAGGGAILFGLVERRATSPLLRLALFREAGLSAGLAMSALVSTVMMATLVVGPFYLSRGLGLETALVGVTLSAGPLVAALAGVPSGRRQTVRRPAQFEILDMALLVADGMGRCRETQLEAQFLPRVAVEVEAEGLEPLVPDRVGWGNAGGGIDRHRHHLGARPAAEQVEIANVDAGILLCGGRVEMMGHA